MVPDTPMTSDGQCEVQQAVQGALLCWIDMTAIIGLAAEKPRKWPKAKLIEDLTNQLAKLHTHLERLVELTGTELLLADALEAGSTAKWAMCAGEILDMYGLHRSEA